MLSVFFMSAAYIQMHYKLLLSMEANTMKPDQTVLREQSDLGPYWLQQASKSL